MLSKKSCEPCRGLIKPLSLKEAKKLHEQTPQWQLLEKGTKLFREFKFNDFADSLKFVNKVGKIAEKEQHHPDIEFGWGYAKITIFTHKIDGLHENDFILASKVDKVIG